MTHTPVESRSSSRSLAPAALALRAAIGVALLAGVCGPARAAVTIDSFGVAQGPLTSPGSSSGSVSSGAILGGERDLVVVRMSGSSSVSAAVASNTLTLHVPAGSSGLAQVVWDGADGSSNVATSGLAATDLTAGGTEGALVLTMSAAPAGAQLMVQVWSDATHASWAAGVLPAIATATPVVIGFKSFFVVPGMSGLADLASVGAVRLTLRASAGASDVDVSATGLATAAPSITATKADALQTDVASDGNASPGDTLRYTIQVTASDADALAAKLDDVPGSNLGTPTNVRTSPIARSDLYTTALGAALVANGVAAPKLLADDSDLDGDPLVATAVNGLATVQGGSVDIAADGSFTYTPPPGFGGVDSFPYTLVLNPTDPAPPGPVTATATIVVDSPPEAVGDSATVLEDSAATSIDVLANDTDIDEGPKSIASAATPGHGTVTLTPVGPGPYTGLTYTPAADFCGSDSFDYQLAPGSSTATVAVTVTCVNDAPSFTKGSDPTVNEDSGLQTIAGWASGIAAGSANESGQTMSFVVTGNTTPSLFASGPAVASDGTLTFTPAANANGSATITLHLHDDGGTANGGVDDSPSQNFVITVSSVNDAPSFTKGADQTVNEDAGPQTVASWATAISPGPADEAAQTVGFLVTGNDAPTLFSAGPAISSTGTLSYTPAPDANGTANLTIVLKDSGGTPNGGSDTSAPQTFAIHVTAVDDAPVVDLDPDNSGSARPGWSLTFTEGDAAKPVADTDAAVTDVDGATLTSLTVTLTNLLDPTFETLDAALTGFPSLSKTYDTTTDPTKGVLTISGATPQPIADFQAVLRTVTYRNTDNAPDGTDRTLQVVAKDDVGTSSAPVIATVRVILVDSPPVAVADAATLLEDASATTIDVLANDTDSDGGPKNIASATSPSHGTVTLTPPGGPYTGLTYTPAANYCGSDSFGYQLTPGTSNATVSITVTCVNDAPAGADNAKTILEDASYTFAAAEFALTDANDTPPNSLLSVHVTSLPTAGTLKLSGSPVSVGADITVANLPNLVYAPAANGNGTPYASFTFQVRDNGGTANGGVDLDPTPNNFTFNVTSVNDAPAGTDKTITLLEDGSYTFTAADFGFSDPSDSLANTFQSVLIALQPSAGSLTLAGVPVVSGNEILASDIAASKLVFTPAADANGSAYASFQFRVRDDGGTSNGGVDLDPTANVITFNVTSVNDAPSGTDKTITINEDNVYSFVDTDFGLTDPKDSPANGLSSVVVVTLPAKGILKLNGSAISAGTEVTKAQLFASQLKFTPGADENGSGNAGNLYASFTFKVRDDGGTANGGVDLDPTPNTMAFDVTPVNDPPVAKAKSLSAQANMKIIGYQINLAADGSGDVTDVDNADAGFTNQFTLVSVTPDANCTGCVVSNVNTSAGTFDFEPGPGLTGSHTLSYVAKDNGNPLPAMNSAAGTITIAIAGPVIWFVDGTNGNDANNGTLAHPFKTLPAVDAVDGASQRIFLYGANTYTGAIKLNTSEWLIGQSVTSTNNLFDEYFGITPPAGTIARPSINGSSANAAARITVASNDKLDGLDMDGTAAQIDNYTTGTFPAGTATGSSGLSVAVGRLRRTGPGNVIAIGGTGNGGSFAFKSVSAVGVTGSTQHGVFVNGFTGSFTVAGNDTGIAAPAGGTISGFGGDGMHFSTLANGTSTALSLKDMKLNGNGSSQAVTGPSCGADFVAGNNLSCVANLYLSSASKIVLDSMTITASGQMGINGNNVTDFVLTNSTVSNNGNEGGEDGIALLTLKGVAAITDTNVKDNAAQQVRIENPAGGSLSLTVNRQTLATMTIGYSTPQLALPSQQGFFFNALGNTALALQIDGVTFTNNFGAGVSINDQGTASVTGYVQSSVFTTNNVGVIIQSVGSSTVGTSTASPFLIQNNTGFTGNQVQGIIVGTGIPSTGGIYVKIAGNQIGTTGNVCNIAGGFNACDGIDVRRFGTNPMAVTISGNTIQRVPGTGIALDLDKSGTMAAKISGNNISLPYFDANNTGAIAISSVVSPSQGGTACVDISSNTIDAGSATFGWDPNGAAAPINTQVKNSGVVTIPSLSGGTSDAAVIAFLPTANTIANNVNGIKAYAKSQSGGTWAGGSSCATP